MDKIVRKKILQITGQGLIPKSIISGGLGAAPPQEHLHSDVSRAGEQRSHPVQIKVFKFEKTIPYSIN